MSVNMRTNFWIDLAILMCFVGVSITGFSLEGDHEVTVAISQLRNVHSWLGITTVALGLLHFVVHWHWWKATFRRFTQLTRHVRTHFIIACVLLVSFALITITGFFLWSGQNTHFLLAAHSVIALVILITVITHLVRHWKWIITTIRRKFTVQRTTKTAPVHTQIR